jgi:hypothetical protein
MLIVSTVFRVKYSREEVTYPPSTPLCSEKKYKQEEQQANSDEDHDTRKGQHSDGSVIICLRLFNA